MSAAPQPQASLYEVELDNPALEKALDARQQAKDKASQARAALKELDDQAKALINTLDLGDDAPVRVGRYIITRRAIEGRSVSFDVDPSKRLYIKLLPEDE